MLKDLKDLDIAKLNVYAKPGIHVGNSIKEACLLSLTYGINIELIHNERSYLINFNINAVCQ